MTVTHNTAMDPKKMHGATHLISRDGVYYYKRRVPQKIYEALRVLPPETIVVIPNELSRFFLKREFVLYSLKTKSKQLATSKLVQAELNFCAQQELMEAWLDSSAQRYDTPTDEAIRTMAQIWVSKELQLDEEKRLDPNFTVELQHTERGMYIMEPEYRSMLAVGGIEKRELYVESVVTDLQKEFRLRLEPSSRAITALRRAVVMGLLHIYDLVKTRNSGVVAPTPHIQRPHASIENLAFEHAQRPSGVAVSLGDVIGRYLKKLPKNTYTRKINGAVKLFGDVMGLERSVGGIRQREVTDYLHDICNLPYNWVIQRKKGIPLESLLEERKTDEEDSDEDEIKRMSPTTWTDNYRSPLETFLKAAARDFGDDGFRSLTTDGIRYVGTREANEDQQRALTFEELKILYEGDQFRRLATDPDERGLYWLSLLSLFTGARPRELCQINPIVDFGRLSDIWYLDINHKSAAGLGIKKSVKTGEARRIPIHSELIRLGVLDYITCLKKDGADRLFPTLRVKSGNPFSATGADFTQLLMECELYDDEAPAGNRIQGIYVLRKTFITEARNQGVMSKEITGHAEGMTTVMQDRHYIFGPEPLQRKAEQIEKFQLRLKIPIRSQQ